MQLQGNEPTPTAKLVAKDLQPQLPDSQPRVPQSRENKVPNRNSNNPRFYYNQLLNNAIKDSKDPEVARLKQEIDDIKKQRGGVIAKIKDTRRRLSYKESEAIAISKLLAIEKQKDANNAKRKRIGYLKKMKNQLEFKISTEASSLNAEKDLVRKIDQINKELSEAYKTIRLERKSEFVKGDVEQYRATLATLETKINDMDKQLDERYDKLRKILGIKRAREEQRPMKKIQPMHMVEINLEDIAVITKKKKKEDNSEESA